MSEYCNFARSGAHPMVLTIKVLAKFSLLGIACVGIILRARGKPARPDAHTGDGADLAL